jgi:hypothetical protein
MRLISPDKYIYDSYPQNHPVITFECEESAEFSRLIKDINSLFSPIKHSQGVDSVYQRNGANVHLYIDDQLSQEAVEAIQKAKKELYDRIREPLMPWWYYVITGLCTIITLAFLKILGWLFKLIFALLTLIHKELKSRFGLTNIQSIAIIASVVALTTVLTFMFTDAKSLFQSSSTKTQQPSIVSSSPSTIQPSATPKPSISQPPPEEFIYDYYSFVKLVYIQYKQDNQAAEAIKNYLKDKKIVVPKIEKISSIKQDDIRFSSQSDRKNAEELKVEIEKFLKDKYNLTKNFKLIDLSKAGYKVPSGQFEIWINQ